MQTQVTLKRNGFPENVRKNNIIQTLQALFREIQLYAYYMYESNNH